MDKRSTRGTLLLSVRWRANLFDGKGTNKMNAKLEITEFTGAQIGRWLGAQTADSDAGITDKKAYQLDYLMSKVESILNSNKDLQRFKQELQWHT